MVREIISQSSTSAPRRGLTLRSFVVCVVALLVMGVWIEYEELYNTYGGPIAENSPPTSAVGVIWVVLVLSALLYKLRRSLRLVTAELVVIYSALVLAAPLMTQGFWHRIFGLLAAIPHNSDFKSYDNLPPMLWPHGPNLVRNGRFAQGPEGYRHLGSGELNWEQMRLQALGAAPCPALSNDAKPQGRSALAFTLERYDASGREVLVPGENYLFSMLVQAEGMAKGSSYYVHLQADDGPELPLLLNTENTAPSFAQPEGFKRVGAIPVSIPTELNDSITIAMGLSGPGRILLQDIQFFNVEAVEGVYAGRKLVRASSLEELGDHERNFTAVRPDNLWSWAGLKYLLQGFIPLRQWVQPAVAWGLLIGGLFLGFLGLNVLMRKQWAENERFTFPLTILPRNLLAESVGGGGERILPIFRNRMMWIGFGATFVLALLKGLKFYYPQIPAPSFEGIGLAQYVSSPLLKTYLQNISVTVWFSLLAIMLLIETDILLSLWTFFWVFQLWFLAGRAFNMNRYPGYPWDFQQAMGAFIAFAILALFVGRHHLARVFRVVAGRARPNEAPDQSREVVSYRTAVLMVAGSLIILTGWGVWTKMGAGASLLFFGYMLVCGFAASKIRAECGAPFAYLTPYYGMQFVAAVGGFALFKSTGMLIATIASGFMCTSCFLLIAPVQVEMMELGRHFGVRPRDIGSGLALGLLGGLFIGGFVVLCWVYGFGANSLKTSWPYEQNWYFNGFRTAELNADRAFASGGPGATPETQPLNFLKNPDAKGLGIGAVLTLVLAALRAKFMWFPFHPLGYVLASSHFMRGAWFGMFLAWLVRLVLFRVGGAQAIRRHLVPFCIGMFLACIASVVFFDLVGVYLRSQGAIEVYSRLP